MRTAHRFSGPGQPYEGLTVLRPKTHRRPGVDWSGVVRLVPEMLDVPLRRKKPTTYFVNSMSDLFHEGLSNEAIAAVFGVMAACPQHVFQVLTKRAQRMREWFEWLDAEVDEHDPPHAVQCGIHAANEGADVDYLGLPGAWPLPNVWLGVSAENQDAADERLPLLRATPAAVRFVSAEPLLGPLDLTPWIADIDLVIPGGESGHNARPCNVEWVRDIVRQCKAAEVACFVKQLGARPYATRDGVAVAVSRAPGVVMHGIKHPKGGDPEEWSDDLRVREMPNTGAELKGESA